MGVIFWRSMISFLFMVLVFRPGAERLKRASVGTTIVYAFMILTFVTATKLTTAANAIFLQYTGPLYVLLLAPFLLKERFRKVDAIAIGAALCGMSFFFVGKLEPGALTGNLVAVVSGAFFGGTVLLLRRDQSRDAMASVILGNLLAAVIAFPFALDFMRLDARGFALVLFLGIVQMGISYALFVRGLSAVPAAEASLLGMLEPMFNPVWAFIGIGETPGSWAILGGAIVLASVAARTLWAAREQLGRRGASTGLAE
jgi:drug/metabolite transporter (DMT)-like permease